MKTIETLSDIQQSLRLIKPEVVLVCGILLLIILGFFAASKDKKILPIVFVTSLIVSIIANFTDFESTGDLFAGVLRKQTYTDALKILIDIGAILTAFLAAKEHEHKNQSQFYVLLLTVVFGCHFLLMSTDMLMIFISLELISIPSYVLTGFAFQKKSAEATMKYFVYGAVASACMVYGFSLLYGFTGSTNILSREFADHVSTSTSYLQLLAILLVIGALLFKVAAAPMHFWAPDVYEAAPTSVVAFFSTVPKVAAIGLLSVLAMPLSNAIHDWQFVLAFVAIITITVGNFAAIAQQNIKRLMAYSSIAQSGFLISAIVIFNTQGLAVIVFYSAVYLVANFLIFHYAGLFEQLGIHTVKQYTGSGRVWMGANIAILVAMVSLTGLPPTAGFTGKLLVFTGIWQSFETTEKPILLILLITGLLNTVVSLFYYLKIPFYAFIKTGNPHERQNFLTIQNLFGLILVVVILMLFFAPGVLMSWINKANFVF